MLTIFSSTKPLIGQFESIQINAITSWKLSCPNSEIILFGDEKGVSEICKELKLQHCPRIKVNTFGTPYINELFLQAQETAHFDVLCYLNADIILLNSLESIILQTKKLFTQFFLVARRWDLDLGNKPLNFKVDWRGSLKHKLQERGKLRHSGAIDCFVFTRNFFSRANFPPFLLGRYYWDGWLLDQALQRKIPIVDISAITIIHQTHPSIKNIVTSKQKINDYGDFKSSELVQEWEENKKLRGRGDILITQTPYILVNNEIKQRVEEKEN